MSIEGKIVNVFKIFKPTCGKCNKKIPEPQQQVVGNKLRESTMAWSCSTYLGTDYYLYETKNGEGVCYCSEWCAKKHNHRFK